MADSTNDSRFRRRNWLAITVATMLMVASYFPYAAAFVGDEIDMTLVAVSVALAPFVFVALGFVSGNRDAPRHIVQSMILMLPIGFGVGLIAPVLGAATAFAAGGALTLNRPTTPGVMRWRWMAVGFTTFYLLALLVMVTPAGVFAGGLVPLMMIGFADEYAHWSAERGI